MAEEAAAAIDVTDKDVGIGGAGLGAAAVELGLVDELRMFRYPVVIGGGTPFLPPVTQDVPLDLIETRTFGSRVIYERYGRASDESGCTIVRVISASRGPGVSVVQPDEFVSADLASDGTVTMTGWSATETSPHVSRTRVLLDTRT